MGCITGLVAHPDRHDHLMIAIDCSLAVVALDPAVNTFEDVAVRVGVGAAFRAAVIALGRTFWICGRTRKAASSQQAFSIFRDEGNPTQ